MLKSLFVVLLMAVASTAVAQDYPPPPPPDNGGNVHYGWADVLRVDPVYAAVDDPPPQQCYQQQTVRQDHDHTGGTVLGAIVGGVLGHTIGKGDGRKAATVAGAVAGGAIGNRVSAAHDRTYVDPQTVCQPVDNYAPQRRIVAYDVEYRYRGEVYVSRLGFDPGERLRVKVRVAPAE
jgi:uncharacterized protein YcfJ